MSSYPSDVETYFQELSVRVQEQYKIAEKARALGHDPELFPEIPQAGDLSDRVEKLVGPSGVAQVIRDFEKQMDREELAFKIAEMIVDGKFGYRERQEAAEQAIRTALAIITEGIVVAPLEGITQVKIKQNEDKSNYLALYLASPIRAAGGTAAALSILIADFVRRKLYLDPYKPTEAEVERYVEEVELYKTTVAPGQYVPSADEVRRLAWNLPIEVTGDPTENKIEVSAFRNLPRVEHNYLRGGAILALVEGLVQKVPKVMKYVTRLNISGWSWLPELRAKEPSESSKELLRKPDKYLDEVIAGRPVFSHPGLGGLGRNGGFRLRYGRARNTGIAAIGVHPATMIVCDDFIAVGTQLKTERPGKGGIAVPVDGIEGPIVKLKNGSVVRVNSIEEARALREQISQVLFLGDLLVGFGEFLENNHPLMPPGYCEEWWAQEVQKALNGKRFDGDILEFLKPPFPTPDQETALKISEQLGVPLHPAYTYFYENIDIEELLELAKWLSRGQTVFERGVLRELKLPLEETPKRLLEELAVPHLVENGTVVIREHALLLCRSFGILKGDRLVTEELQAKIQKVESGDIFELLSAVAGFPIRKKGSTYIGARMGRPEKANAREMSPAVHVLFPIGQAGGKTRNIVEAARYGNILVEIAQLECKRCGARIHSKKCPNCGGEGEFVKVCPQCGQPTSEKCPVHRRQPTFYTKKSIEIGKMFNDALERLGENTPRLVKGVQGMTSEFKIPEPLEKGILRAKHGVVIFKDGTIRFDATNVPLTHFKPQEIGVSVEKLRELGYTEDCEGNPLESDDQLVDLKVQDIVVSKKCAEYLLRTSQFVDLAPHTSVGMVGRIIGFTEANVCYAHPFFHAAKRRDCDGDEDCVMLLLDALLNFSKRFLPSSRGGRMDAPLLLSTRLNPKEIDKEAHNMDISSTYPLEFYDAAWRGVSPSELQDLIETAGKRLGTGKEYGGFGFSVGTSNIAIGPVDTKYKTLETMEEKVRTQMKLAERIRAVDPRDVAELVIDHHFIRDMKGNIRTFSAQTFRCVSCNKKYRRVPLKGACLRCGGKLVLTVSRGGVEKYLNVAMQLAEEYSVSDYTKQRLMLLKRDIESMFESDVSRQTSLADFLR